MDLSFKLFYFYIYEVTNTVATCRIKVVFNCKYFTTLDINSAFWCIMLKKEDCEKTAFITKSGKFEFKVFPFDFKNSPSIFQRILSNIIRRNGLEKFCMNYNR